MLPFSVIMYSSELPMAVLHVTGYQKKLPVTAL